jgi:hypothetical protein
MADALEKKVVHTFALLQSFSKQLPNKNNHPMGENLPNLVTLLPDEFKFFFQFFSMEALPRVVRPNVTF